MIVHHCVPGRGESARVGRLDPYRASGRAPVSYDLLNVMRLGVKQHSKEEVVKEGRDDRQIARLTFASTTCCNAGKKKVSREYAYARGVDGARCV